MDERPTYAVDARRDGRWWFIQVPELGTSGQARSVSKIEEAARDIIAIWLDTDRDRFDIDLSIEIPDGIRQLWQDAKEREASARSEEAAAAALARRAVSGLRAEGLSYKEAGLVLGLSSQRVHQLAQASSKNHGG